MLIPMCSDILNKKYVIKITVHQITTVKSFDKGKEKATALYYLE